MLAQRDASHVFAIMLAKLGSSLQTVRCRWWRARLAAISISPAAALTL
jgi:hypothetical protein